MRRGLLALLSVLLAPADADAQERDDAYLAGYAEAILERELRIPNAVVRVRGGVITLLAPSLGNADIARVTEILRRIPGVILVEIDQDSPIPADTRPVAPPLSSGPGASVETKVEAPSSSFLLRAPLLFEPLHADPRWPHFSAAYHYYSGNDELQSVGTASFGESFSLHRQRIGEEAQWEVGLQAGVFSIFDLDAASHDLVNTDYFVGPTLGWRNDGLSLLGRLYHQSSHLGDEYLLRTRVNRVNLSYEVADLLLSWDVTDALRVYAGGGYILHSAPELDPWTTQGGVEAFGRPFGGGNVRPLLAIDLQAREEHDWGRDVSVRTGLQFEDTTAGSLRFQVLLEYYRGRSPNGQFLDQDVEFFGIGLHFQL
jgi:hypothetical protein